MDYIKVGNKKIKFSKINFIMITDHVSMSTGKHYYFLTFVTDNGPIDALRIENKETLKRRLKQFSQYLSDNNIKNFACLDNEYVINIDNVEMFAHLSNKIGEQLVQAIFKDGTRYNLYFGYNKNYARHLNQRYHNQEAEYIESLKM